MESEVSLLKALCVIVDRTNDAVSLNRERPDALPGCQVSSTASPAPVWKQPLGPVSSVMIKRTFGAPLGGTTLAGQYGVDCEALRSILPKFGSQCGELIVRDRRCRTGRARQAGGLLRMGIECCHCEQRAADEYPAESVLQIPFDHELLHAVLLEGHLSNVVPPERNPPPSTIPYWPRDKYCSEAQGLIYIKEGTRPLLAVCR
jgi:hypothetical protein